MPSTLLMFIPRSANTQAINATNILDYFWNKHQISFHGFQPNYKKGFIKISVESVDEVKTLGEHIVDGITYNIVRPRKNNETDENGKPISNQEAKHIFFIPNIPFDLSQEEVQDYFNNNSFKVNKLSLYTFPNKKTRTGPAIISFLDVPVDHEFNFIINNYKIELLNIKKKEDKSDLNTLKFSLQKEKDDFKKYVEEKNIKIKELENKIMEQEKILLEKQKRDEIYNNENFKEIKNKIVDDLTKKSQEQLQQEINAKILEEYNKFLSQQNSKPNASSNVTTDLTTPDTSIPFDKENNPSNDISKKNDEDQNSAQKNIHTNSDLSSKNIEVQVKVTNADPTTPITGKKRVISGSTNSSTKKEVKSIKTRDSISTSGSDHDSNEMEYSDNELLLSNKSTPVSPVASSTLNPTPNDSKDKESKTTRSGSSY
jgi:hypothetical protein